MINLMHPQLDLSHWFPPSESIAYSLESNHFHYESLSSLLSHGPCSGPSVPAESMFCQGLLLLATDDWMSCGHVTLDVPIRFSPMRTGDKISSETSISWQPGTWGLFLTMCKLGSWHLETHLQRKAGKENKSAAKPYSPGMKKKKGWPSDLPLPVRPSSISCFCFPWHSLVTY